MATPAEVDIIADRRVPYAESFSFLGENWTGSTLRIQFRLVRDTTGTPLADGTSPTGVGISYAGSATVSAHITAGRLTSEIYTIINPATGVPYVAGDTVLLTQIGFYITPWTTFPYPEERGNDLVTYYDIIREPAAGDNVMVMRGTFTVRAGVTIP